MTITVDDMYQASVFEYATEFPEMMKPEDHLKDGARERHWGVLLGLRAAIEHKHYDPDYELEEGGLAVHDLVWHDVQLVRAVIRFSAERAEDE